MIRGIMIHECSGAPTHLLQPMRRIQQRDDRPGQLLTFNLLQQHSLLHNGVFEDHFRSTSSFHGSSIHNLMVTRQIGFWNNESRFAHS